MPGISTLLLVARGFFNVQAVFSGLRPQGANQKKPDSFCAMLGYKQY